MTQTLCGRKVAVGVGTIIATLSKKASAQCQADGKQAIELKNYPSVSAAVLGLSAQRIGYVWTDSVSAATQAEKSNGQFVSVSDGTEAEPSGIAFPKDATGLSSAFRAGLQAIIDNGTYRRILAKYGLTSGAVTKAEVNGAVG
ncbi:transporter substrate-binding domain-containing protein [Flexivirga oryzae]|uniref:ABC-type amino acid transport substrate-binding protein n=1 Tax=Flexivirga oryzae TaxID=1794944 RepID=A0A839N7H6_9MICO|nr:transporter substrate-binding domain-containing protein [Flexivirga oryzae]MBB2890632.1 ABC-type amino acid transport substrate-binding protein [Flexivirga oryzae]